MHLDGVRQRILTQAAFQLVCKLLGALLHVLRWGPEGVLRVDRKMMLVGSALRLESRRHIHVALGCHSVATALSLGAVRHAAIATGVRLHGGRGDAVVTLSLTYAGTTGHFDGVELGDILPAIESIQLRIHPARVIIL